MAQSKIMHGARAVVQIGNKKIGGFTTVSYGSAYDIQPAFVLGAYGPVELTITGAEPIGISASGWRIIGHGPFTPEGGGMPRLQDLLTAEDSTFSLYDRQTDQLIMVVEGVRHAGFSTSVSPKALEEISYNFVGLRLKDETNRDNAESSNAARLP